MTLVVDASVALKWLHSEIGSTEADALLTRGELVIAPDLVVPEVCNVTWKMIRRGMMTPDQQASAMTRLPAIFDEIVPTETLARRAAAISTHLDHPAYDCFYLALAEQRGATLVTADRRLVARVKDTPWAACIRDFRDGE